ncbi:transcriptional regulator [Burkholderia cenocepacia]|uniref:transcriptional regulator n=1 Tax=Burkholderia cenocepacia TaxID=95486 RepID=UPI0013E0B7F0|nr:YdaS family helix-turn-helix protein [Burkholderia cenocepacia]MCW3583960.1 helix-turn-helix domain-containing protein [Burkholderia cenocepacia]MCW3629601.1 helix-turn-helix domain-containing protein [Burkholderia cenocepacia]MCW5182629.1 helix-turn-helix domain-containing protein [Burkholderia cenocepacia]
MEKLKSFLAAASKVERESFASRCGTTPAFLRNVIYGTRRAGEKLCVAIERESGGAITRRDLRPDDWQDIWPELADLSNRADASDDVQPPAGVPDRKEGN